MDKTINKLALITGRLHEKKAEFELKKQKLKNGVVYSKENGFKITGMQARFITVPVEYENGDQVQGPLVSVVVFDSNWIETL